MFCTLVTQQFPIVTDKLIQELYLIVITRITINSIDEYWIQDRILVARQRIPSRISRLL